jgi:hypothetical protein
MERRLFNLAAVVSLAALVLLIYVSWDRIMGNVPVDFYGVVTDDHGQPLSDVQVTATVMIVRLRPCEAWLIRPTLSKVRVRALHFPRQHR